MPGSAASGSSASANDAKCLPAQACLAWQGCVRIEQGADAKWTVVQSERADLKGQLATYSPQNVCSDGSLCPAALIDPAFLRCPPHTIPPVVVRPNFECIAAGGRCRSKMLPPPPAPPPPPVAGRELIEEKAAALRACYPKSTAGVVTLTWTVAQDGSVGRVEVLPMQPSLRDEKAHACLRAVIEKIRFLPVHVAAYQYRLQLPGEAAKR
jgi:hypothetical protein